LGIDVTMLTLPPHC